MDQSDRTLLQGCIAGDRRSWETLVNRYSSYLFTIARECGLTHEDAEDVLQTVFAKLLDNMESIKDDGHLQAWLATSVRRLAWRARFERDRTVNLVPEEELPVHDVLPDEEMLRLERIYSIRRALETIGESCRTLLHLLYEVEPRPRYRDIARELNLSEGAIGPTRARCLTRLKKYLEKKRS